MDKVHFHFSQPEESSGYLLWQISMLWQRNMKHELDKINLTHTQFVLLAALAWLSRNNTTVTQVNLSKHSKTDRMMVSKVLRTLQKKKYILRNEHETDTRAKSIVLTDDGENILNQAIKIVEKVDSDFFSVLNSDEKLFNTHMQTIFKKHTIE
jgi:DNA-binding MarR family transcriptional regulator